MRKLLTAVLILFICQYVTAQTGRFNVKGGATLFILQSTNDKTKDFSHGRVGYTLGAGYEMKINKSFSIQPELNYSYQVAREEYVGSELKVSYTQVPILFRYHPGKGAIALYAGPQVSFLGSAKTNADDGGGDVGISSQLNQTDFGIAIGVARVPLTNGLTVDVRVYKGLMAVYKAEYDDGLKTRPAVISVTVGYIFGKKP